MLSISCKSCVRSRRNQKNSQRIRTIKPSINKYNWKGINYPSVFRIYLKQIALTFSRYITKKWHLENVF